MQATRHARLFRNGRNQALRIPREFELLGKEVLIHQEGPRLIIEPVKKVQNRLAAILNSWKPMRKSFPKIKDLPADEVDV